MNPKSFTVPKLRRCGHCAHFLVEKPARAHNAENIDRGGWCSKNEVSTSPGLLRCGGDDFVKKRPMS